MLLLSIDEVVERARVGKTLASIRDQTNDVQYLAYYPERESVIHVEVTVPNFCEMLLRLSIPVQTVIIAAIAKLLHSEGDQIGVFQDGENKKRSVRVIRIRGLNSDVKTLLITR